MPQHHPPAAALDAPAPRQHASEPPSAGPFLARRAVVEVPATSANLGPGFDCVALALTLRNTFDVTIAPLVSGSHECRVEVTPASDDQPRLPDIEQGSDNLFCQAFALLCERQRVAPPDMTVHISAQIPPSRGLGSSATAVVGGLLAANVLLGQPYTTTELVELAILCEPGGHADNVAAALLGGLVVTGARDSAASIVSLTLPVPEALRAVVFIPDAPMSTVAGRALLPERYTRGDVTFNLSRLALLLAALHTGRFDALATAMDDRVHQPYRQQLFPQLHALMAAARAAGAHGACLSGGGSSVLALVSEGAERVRVELAHAAEALGVSGRCIIADIARQGATATLADAAPETHGKGIA
jgi:homoserine kinase